MIIDLKHLNNHFNYDKVKFENLAVLRNTPDELEYGFSIDISDAYHHLAVHREIARYMTFFIDGEYF